MNDTLTAPVLTKKNKILVYFLASPEDKDECIGIKKYLSPVIRNSQVPIEVCSDFDVVAGDEIEKYKAHLYEADIVLALISADFINNDDTYLRTQKVIEKYNRNEVIIFPILVRNCLWKSTPFVKLPLLPKNFQPLNNKQFWNSEDDALTAVVTDVSEAISKFSTYQAAAKTDAAASNHYEHTMPTVIEEAIPAKNNVVQENIQPAFAAQSIARVQVSEATTSLEVDWRKQYYKNVLWKRAAAFFLDNIITFLPAFFVTFAICSVIIVDTTPDEYGNTPKVSDSQVELILLISLSVYFIVCAAMESSGWRGTMGKRILKLQITDKEGHPVSFFRAFWRNIMRWVAGYSYLLIFPLVIQYFTFQKTKQLFHDQLSFTVIGEKLTR